MRWKVDENEEYSIEITITNEKSSNSDGPLDIIRYDITATNEVGEQVETWFTIYVNNNDYDGAWSSNNGGINREWNWDDPEDHLDQKWDCFILQVLDILSHT